MCTHHSFAPVVVWHHPHAASSAPPLSSPPLPSPRKNTIPETAAAQRASFATFGHRHCRRCCHACWYLLQHCCHACSWYLLQRRCAVPVHVDGCRCSAGRGGRWGCGRCRCVCKWQGEVRGARVVAGGVCTRACCKMNSGPAAYRLSQISMWPTCSLFSYNECWLCAHTQKRETL